MSPLPGFWRSCPRSRTARLTPQREAALREQIARSAELSERYERERRAVAALAAVRTDRAPGRLRARIEAERRERTPRGWPRLGIGWGTAAAAVVAVAALAVVLLLPAGTPGGPSVSQAASLALRGDRDVRPRARWSGARCDAQS